VIEGLVANELGSSREPFVLASQLNEYSTYEVVMKVLEQGEYEAVGQNVIDIQAIGSYLLIMLDEEKGGTVLVARVSEPKTQGDVLGSSIQVWEISEDGYSCLEQDAIIETIEKIGEWVDERNKIKRKTPSTAGRKGWGGLCQPHGIVWENNPLLQMDLFSVIYERRTRESKSDPDGIFFNTARLDPKTGIHITLYWRYNQQTGEVFLNWSAPIAIAGFNDFDAALRRYKAQLDNPAALDLIDASNFVLASAGADIAPPYRTA